MKKGFTLVELLAVIVILAVILAISIPSISSVVKATTKNAFESDLKMVIKAVDYKMLGDNSFDPSTVNETTVNSLLGLNNSNYKTLTVKKMNDVIYVTIVGQNKWDNLTVTGTMQNVSVGDTVTTFVRGANAPVLATGMIPIKWSGTAWADTTEADVDWYNYDTTNKIWANARTADGSMWVWIPRYVYRISTGWHTNTAGTIDIQFTKGVDDNWNKGVIGTIDLREGAEASNAATNSNKYTNHPAFTFGDKELTGFWIAKFEPTASEGVSNGYTADASCPITGDDVTTKTVKIVPNVVSWRCIQAGNAFTVSRNMETNSVYGWGTSGTNIDTHLMKNTEWGAVSYLSKSAYGQNTNEIWINNANDFTTGCAANSATQGASTTGCLNAYNTTNGVKASTTGTIYGIYDMSGGAWERNSAYVNNANGNLNTYGASIISAAAQYKDVYTVGGTDDKVTNYGLTINLKGDAVYETSNSYTGSTSWFGDDSTMPETSYPWFSRGGCFMYESFAGAFYFVGTNGIFGSVVSFRPVLLVGTGL